MKRFLGYVIIAASFVFCVNGYGVQAAQGAGQTSGQVEAGQRAKRSAISLEKILAMGKAALEKVLLSKEATYQEIIEYGGCSGFLAAMNDAEKKSHAEGEAPKSLSPGYTFTAIYLVGQYANLESYTKIDPPTLQKAFGALQKSSAEAKASASVLFEDAKGNKEKISTQTNFCRRKIPLLIYVSSQKEKLFQNK